MKIFVGRFRGEDVYLDSDKDRMAIALIKHQHEQLVLFHRHLGARSSVETVRNDAEQWDTETTKAFGARPRFKFNNISNALRILRGKPTEQPDSEQQA